MAAALLGISACGGGSDAAPPQAAIAPVVAETTQVLTNAFAWTEVPYAEYLDTAQQLSIRPDVLVHSERWTASLEEICTAPASSYQELRTSQLASNDTDTGDQSTAQYLRDETSLRITLACPQRMADWIAVPEAESVDDLAAEEAAAEEEQYDVVPAADADFTESSFATPSQPGGHSERTADTGQ
ncbi:MAG: hypothetical protein ACT4PP_03750 [Sporichthyaceae bacterium]